MRLTLNSLIIKIKRFNDEKKKIEYFYKEDKIEIFFDDFILMLNVTLNFNPGKKFMTTC